MLKFGFKPLRREEVMLFPFPYLVMESKPLKEGKNTKFLFKNGVRELLKFGIKENKISWVYDPNEVFPAFYLINVRDIEADPTININLDLSFSNKKLYEKMEKVLSLDTTEDNFFQLIYDEVEGLPAVRIEVIGNRAELEDVTEESNAVEAGMIENTSEFTEEEVKEVYNELI